MQYQLVEIKDASANICCPFCQQAVVDWNEEQYIQPCEHTLFIAMDLGFEFVSDQFESKMQQTVDELHDDPDMNVFEAIDSAHYENVMLYKAELGVENLFRYVGFSQY